MPMGVGLYFQFFILVIFCPWLVLIAGWWGRQSVTQSLFHKKTF